MKRMTTGKFQFSKACALSLFVTLPAGCGRSAKREQTEASAAASAAGSAAQPILSLSQTRLDLGTILPNQVVEHRVELLNSGASIVHFRQSATSSRCQWSEALTELAPHAKVIRGVRCQSDLLGPLKEQLTLTDERFAQPTTLEITGTVTPLLAFDTPFVDLRPEFGQTVHADVSVIGAQVGQAKLTLEAAPPSVVSVTALPTRNGEIPRFRLTCRASRVGMHAGSLVAKTGLADPPSISVSWSCRVQGTLEVNPSNPYFNLKVSGDKAVTVEVKSSQRGFAVHSVHVKDGPFAASLEPSDSNGAYHIIVKVLNGQIPDETRSASGTLVIESNDAREPLKEVPLFGFGQINKVDR